MNAKIGGKLFFDITDIIDYGVQGTRVSGIQRVVINVICNLAARYGEERIVCFFLDRQKDALFQCNASILMPGREFDPEMMRYKLKLHRNWKGFPDRDLVKAHLKPFRASGKELSRTIRKWDIYLSSLFMPQRLRRYGLMRTRDRFANEPQVSVQPLSTIAGQDTLALLGGNWRCDPVREIARRHRSNGGVVVQMVYDLIPHQSPQFFLPALARDFNAWLEGMKEYCSKYLCISESTATDLRRFLRDSTANADVTAIPLAHEVAGYVRNARTDQLTARVAEIAHDRFVLCVGTLEVRKNGVLLLRAWKQLHEEMGAKLPRLVFAGRRGWLIDEFDRLRSESGVAGCKIDFIDAPSDAELASLYGKCLFTVFPSFYEGWGLPVGESAWFGKFCIASNASSIPEVCGDLVDYSAPDDLDGYLAKLRRAICDRTYLQEREANIAAAPLRSWSDVAEQIARALIVTTPKNAEENS